MEMIRALVPLLILGALTTSQSLADDWLPIYLDRSDREQELAQGGTGKFTVCVLDGEFWIRAMSDTHMKNKRCTTLMAPPSKDHWLMVDLGNKAYPPIVDKAVGRYRHEK
jgi:hypothetical protein